MSYANSLLEDGFNIPLPKNVTQHMKNEKLTMYDQYLLIDGEFDYNFYQNKGIGET